MAGVRSGPLPWRAPARSSLYSAPLLKPAYKPATARPRWGEGGAVVSEVSESPSLGSPRAAAVMHCEGSGWPNRYGGMARKAPEPAMCGKRDEYEMLLPGSGESVGSGDADGQG